MVMHLGCTSPFIVGSPPVVWVNFAALSCQYQPDRTPLGLMQCRLSCVPSRLLILFVTSPSVISPAVDVNYPNLIPFISSLDSGRVCLEHRGKKKEPLKLLRISRACNKPTLFRGFPAIDLFPYIKPITLLSIEGKHSGNE